MANQTRVLIINPLGSALAHYTNEVEEVLSSLGYQSETISFLEPSATGRGRWTWLREYVRAIRSASRAKGHFTLVTWPVMGMLDLAILRAFGVRRGAVVFHDPRPLVKAVGYGYFARLAGRGAPGIDRIVHSEAALFDARESLGMQGVKLLPHPVLSVDVQYGAESRAAVRVLGQYKQTRSIEALHLISESAIADDHQLQIVGRGWPNVDGWSTDDQFVSEPELDRLIATSAAVVIPYARFYQSGIAIRCLELGTPFVGPAGTSLGELVGPTSPLLVNDDDWVTAVRHAVKTSRAEMLDHRSGYLAQVREAYRQYLDSRVNPVLSEARL